MSTELDYDMIPLCDLRAEDIKRVIITNRGGSVAIKTSELSIRDWYAKNTDMALKYRPEYGGYCTEKSGARYVSVCVEMR